ncbi:MAG: TetR/AcrR family transcriptional regulator C-terminal domain-containing protein [Clostridia bacterium]|nr:TetR/AcrR family transcriptional regulator C-terminal domain-containing protein [Clostridia bacterium]
MSQFTKKAIIESFEKLIESKPLDRITVKDIVADCGVTRNTFYYHFEDIFDLAKTVLSERLTQIGTVFGQENDWEGFFLLLAKSITKNRRTIRNFIHSGKSKETSRFIRQILVSAVEKLFDRIAEGKEIAPAMRTHIVEFYANAALATAMEKLDSGAEDAELWIRRICQFLYTGLSGAIQASEQLI